MPAFKVSGATGQAPTTSFFGAVPDKFNMLWPMHEASNAQRWDKMIAANNINQWTIYNTSFDGGANADSVSLGALTIAPDGTNTAQKIVETATNSIHALTAGARMTTRALPIGVTPGVYKERLAVIAKAAERTRIVLYVNNDRTINGASFNGCKTVFDLAGGQIGVANTAFGTNGWLPGDTSITPVGGGFYLCMMDVTIGVYPDTDMAMTGFYLDAGSGTAAENSIYVGDGTSGVYAWRSTMMPPAAWGMTGQRTFFDDFNDNTMANIDLTDSRAPGFNWYIHNDWPNPGFQAAFLPPTDPARFSVAGSKLTIAGASIVGVDGLQMMSAATDGGAGYVGHAFAPPFIMEANTACSAPPGPGQALGILSFWTTSIEGLVSADNSANMVEIDFFEHNSALTNIFGPNFNMFYGNDTSGISFFQSGLKISFNGYGVWNPFVLYNSNFVVWYLGSLYQNIAGSLNDPPATSPTKWSPFTPLVTEPSAPNTAVIDFTQSHTWSGIWLPMTHDQCGQILLFVDGVYVQSSLIPYGHGIINHGPTLAEIFISDHCHQPINFAAGRNFSQIIDWVSVTQ